MDLSGIADTVTAFCRDNPIITVVVGLFLLFLLYRKPKLFFGLLCLALILAGVLYVIMDVASIGKSQKGQLVERSIHPETDDVR